MRRLGKEAYMFTFNGEPHGLRNRDNMKHWTVHMDEFFDYYLLGKPRPAWMDNGVPFLEKGTRDVAPLFKKAVNRARGDGRARAAGVRRSGAVGVRHRNRRAPLRRRRCRSSLASDPCSNRR